MLTAQQQLKKKIAAVENERILENVKCFVMGMKAQEEIDLKKSRKERKGQSARREV